MQKTKHTINKWMRTYLKEFFPEITFFPEPQNEAIIYPAVVMHWGGSKPTTTYCLWQTEVQVDIIYNGHRTNDCDVTTIEILRAMKLTKDSPNEQSRINKTDYTNPQSPADLPYTDIRIRLSEGVQPIDEPGYPELRRNSFVLSLIHKDD